MSRPIGLVDNCETHLSMNNDNGVREAGSCFLKSLMSHSCCEHISEDNMSSSG